MEKSTSNEISRISLASFPNHLPKFRTHVHPSSLTPHTCSKKLSSLKKKSLSKRSVFQTVSSNKPLQINRSSLTRHIICKPIISSQSWIIIESIKGRAIDGKCDEDIREIASLTKIMTCITAIHEIEKRQRSFEEVVRVDEKAANMDGTSADLRVGDEIKIWDLLHGLMLPSGNDAAIVISQFVGGIIDRSRDPVETFVEKMNSNAIALKLFDTNFTNPHGMSTSINLSSAKSIAFLSAYAIRNKLFSQIVRTKKHVCSIFNPNGTRKVEWNNTNLMLDKGFSGLKTGHTPAAGPCLSFSVEKKKKRFIGVLLGTKSMELRWVEAMQLCKYAYAQV